MPHINVRVTEAQKAELEARCGGQVSEYVRQQLFGDQGGSGQGLDVILDRIDHLADDLAEGRLTPPTPDHAAGGNDQLLAMLAEVLLLLRGSVKADAIRSAKGELNRHGITPWGAE